MSKHVLFTATILFLTMGAFTPVYAQKKKQKQVSGKAANSDVKFLDAISIEPIADPNLNDDPKSVFPENLFTSQRKSARVVSGPSIESASSLQLKYALLLDVEVEQISNLDLIKVLEDWMGTRYRYGGTTKSGIDCSAFMQTVFSSVYGIDIPRTAREQYDFAQHVSRTDLREGDLVFFNTTGGVSHVGMYLQNNKFVHASSSGVMISDLYDPYWTRRFIGVGRVEPEEATALSIKP